MDNQSVDKTMLNDEKLKEQADKFIGYVVKKEIQRLAEEYTPAWLKDGRLHNIYANKNALERQDRPNGRQLMQSDG